MKKRRLFCSLLATAFFLLFASQTVFASDQSKIRLSNVSLSIGSSNGLIPEISGDGTMFTFNDTKGEDVERYMHSSSSLKFHFIANVDRFLYHETGDFWDYGDKSNGIGLENKITQPYTADPNYAVFGFTMRDMNGRKTTHIIIRIRKWESQYEKTEKSPDWSSGLFFCSTYRNGVETVRWKTVAGKPHHHEFVAAENVTFPFSLTIRCGINYKTQAYLDGKEIFLPGPKTFYTKTLVFNQNKASYDFMIDPKDSLDTKYTKGVRSHWRIVVKGNSVPKPQDKTNIRNADISAIPNKSYSGKSIKPSLNVTLNGKRLVPNINYTLKYGTNKNIGKGIVTITGTGKFTGSKKIVFNIVPSRTSISKMIVFPKQIKLEWKKVPKAQKITKYEIRYRVKGTSKWRVKLCAPSDGTATIKGLARGRSYQVQIRSYRMISRKKYYSAWSNIKNSQRVR